MSPAAERTGNPLQPPIKGHGTLTTKVPEAVFSQPHELGVKGRLGRRNRPDGGE